MEHLGHRDVIAESPDVEMTYLVSGHPRTGTSMMMQALAAGGLEAAYSPAMDRAAANANDYVQNPNGFFELSPNMQRQPWFPMGFRGKLIKVQYVQLGGLAPGRYKVVFMLRHPREIRMSYQAMGGKSASLVLEWRSDEDYEPMMQRYMAAAAMRMDMEVLALWYHDVIEQPLASFRQVRDFGLPIDPERAAEKVDASLYRHRVASRPMPEDVEPSR